MSMTKREARRHREARRQRRVAVAEKNRVARLVETLNDIIEKADRALDALSRARRALDEARRYGKR